jgi:Fur family peroxide stress response transcriptional regulator
MGVEVEAGLTPQRRVVLEAIRESDGHPTANEVFASARARLDSISYATVYNSLHYLCESGLVREITFGNGASRYDRVISRHDHAICERCGKLVDFDLLESLELMRKAARRVHFKPASIHLTLVGLCPSCQNHDADSGLNDHQYPVSR